MIKIKPLLKPGNITYISLLIFSLFICFLIIRNFVAGVYYQKWDNAGGEIEDRISFLEKAIHLTPSQSWYWYERGRYYHKEAYKNNSPEDQEKILSLAETSLKKAILLQPGNSRYLSEFARLIGNRGEIEKAITCFETSLSLAAKDAHIHKKYAIWTLSYARRVIPIDDMEFLIEMYRDPEELISTYERKFISGVPVKTILEISEREWNEALRLRIPKDREIYKNLASLSLIKGEIDEAIVNYRNARENVKLAYCYFIKKDLHNVFQQIKQVVEKQDENLESEWNTINTLLCRVIMVNKDIWEAYYWLGRGYYQLDMFEEAVENLRNAVQINPGSIESRLYLAKSYDEVGKTDRAIDEYMGVLRIKPGHNEANTLLTNALKKEF
ncbi:MAG: tetratricopeptide repeat protein [wastewater metagenome]|nr:tetratricopeptide repeat protein [Candidatus Loosdrechtia aerotolerans]